MEQMSIQIDRVVKSEGLTLTEDGSRALTKLACGDMRRALNILQSTSMAHKVVNSDNIYTCTGHPLESEIASIIGWMLTEDMSVAYANILELKTAKGLALQDILIDVHSYTQQLDLPAKARIYLLEKFGAVEIRLSSGADEAVQLGALVSAFRIAREIVSEAELAGH